MSALQSLIDAVYARAETEDAASRYGALVAVLKENHYWPALQVKHFFDNSGLTLLHNTYTRSDVEAFQELYDECRSVVLDLSQPADANIVVSLANVIPVRMTVEAYRTEPAAEPADIVERSYNGTVISVYNHNDTWHFGTSTCPVIDRSRFAHPTKTHGAMMDEALVALGADIEFPRAFLTSALDPAFVYTFILVHHENARAPSASLTDAFGADYAKLVHIGTRCRATLVSCDLAVAPLSALGIVYATRFDTPEAGLTWLIDNPASCGLIVKRGAQLIKVMTGAALENESMDLGNANPWVNMLWVYMQNKPHYHINDYIERFLPGFAPPVAPTYVIHTAVCTMRDIILSLYNATTRYYSDHKRFKMDTHVDGALAPIVRFHLAQLRRVQITRHTHAPINGRTIYHYLCLHTTMKNMRGLIRHFAESTLHYGMPPKTAECFVSLDMLLRE